MYWKPDLTKMKQWMESGGGGGSGNEDDGVDLLLLDACEGERDRLLLVDVRDVKSIPSIEDEIFKRV